MRGYHESTYGDRIADVYDDVVEDLVGPGATDAAVALLTGLAGGGPVLELGIGTGRLALPLASKGLQVWGIESSERMIAALRAKPGGDSIRVERGDFADVAVPGPFSLVFVAFNTLFALLTQEAQVRCFENVAARLAGGGCFVVDAFVPDLARFDRHQRVSVERVEVDELVLEMARHDPVNQRVDSHTVVLSAGSTRLYPVSLRYAWPSELDLMAELAGLSVRARYGSWAGEEFTSASGRHVTVYGRRRERR